MADPVDECICKHVTCARPSRAERPPLPVIIFTAKQKVHQENSDGSAGYDHDAVAEEEESEHVVDFAKPHVIHDVVELDEYGAERKDANKEHGWERTEGGC